MLELRQSRNDAGGAGRAAASGVQGILEATLFVGIWVTRLDDNLQKTSRAGGPRYAQFLHVLRLPYSRGMRAGLLGVMERKSIREAKSNGQTTKDSQAK